MGMTTTTDTFPRNCEMGNGALRLGYTSVTRAHDAAIAEQAFRSGELTGSQFAALATEIEGRRYSTWG